MKKLVFAVVATMLLVWSAAAQTPAAQNPQPQANPNAQQAPQNVPITEPGGQQNRNPQRGEDVGQQGKGVPAGGQPQAATPGGENALPPNTAILATLSKGLDAKKAKEGDPVTAKVEQDVLNQGNVVVPHGSRLIGHVSMVRPRAKGENESVLGIAWDKAVLKDDREIPLHAIIQAVSAPQHMITPMGGMGTENQGMAGGAGAQGGMAGSMGNPGMGNPGVGNPGGQAGSAGGVATPAGGNQPQEPAAGGSASGGRVLMAGSSGVHGMPGVALKVNQQGTSLLTDQQHNVKLEGGTQLVLRVVQ